MQIENVLYRSPFSGGYWKTSLRQLHHLPSLVLAALFVALRVAVSTVRIPIADNLNIMFSYLVAASGSMIYGPVLGVMSGFVSDILGYLLHPDGPFFIGYTISEMLGALVYALFLYRARISVVRICCCRLTVNLFLNIGLGCLWSQMMYGKGYLYYLAKSVVKNAILLPIEVVLMVVVLQALIPLAVGLKIMPSATPKKIVFWNRREKSERPEPQSEI